MKVICFASRKGGGGKSTLACHVAAALGGRVALVDVDPQESARRWANLRRMPVVSARRLAESREALALTYDWIVVDTAGSFDPLTQRAIAQSDYLVVPVRPSGLDLAAVEATLGLAVELDRPYMLVLNQCSSRVLSAAAREALEGLELCPHEIRSRVAWQHAMIDGRTVEEAESSPRLGTMEFRDVCDHLFAWIGTFQPFPFPVTPTQATLI